jgi:acyl-phosphate glycerol 3-phosphate acyltransferase
MSSPSPLLNDLLACLLGYMIGAIPFGYLVFYAARGIDIRTVGSGNLGATNVGRNLGFRYFLLVFALDVLKGFVPTAGLPLVLKRLGMAAIVDLPVYIAIATVLGHSFPIYLGFKGGKGVATSLGALLALEPTACTAAVVGFFVPFFIWRYVSLSSICGALGFVTAHFLLVSDPWNREHRAMSVLSIAIAVLVIARHYKNIRRLLAGTEPKVSLRGSRSTDPTTSQPAGRVHRSLLFVLAVLGIAIVGPALWLVRHAREPVMATAGPWSLRETHRELTGQQRCSRVVFADHGKMLAVLCPRYNKILLYRVTSQASLEPVSEIAVEGRPVAIAAAGERIVVLERPANDDKHLQPGWWETFGLDGHKVGPRVAAGYYPDDLAVTPDGRLLLVLSSGQGEGDKKKPLPGIEVFTTTFEPNAELPIGRLNLQPGDDPDRLWLSASGTRGLITLPKTKQTVAIDLSRPEAPTVAGRSDLAQADGPYVSSSTDDDWIVMPASGEHEAVALQDSNSPAGQGRGICSADYLVYTRPEQSVLELVQVTPRCIIGRFPLKGPLNLAGTSPSGLAFSPERGLLAVTTKPGAVHLIAVHSRVALEADWPTPAQAAMIKLSVDDDSSRLAYSIDLPR